MGIFKLKKQTGFFILTTLLVLVVGCGSKTAQTNTSLIINTAGGSTETKTAANGWITYNHPSGNNFSISLPSTWRVLNIDTNDPIGSINRITDLDPELKDILNQPDALDGAIFFAFDNSATFDDATTMRIKITWHKINMPFDQYLTGSMNALKNMPLLNIASLKQYDVKLPFGHGKKITYQAIYKGTNGPPFQSIQYILSDGPDVCIITFRVPIENLDKTNKTADQIAESFHLTK